MKSIHADLLSIYNIRAGGGGEGVGGGGSKLHGYFFSSRLYSFIFVCFCLFRSRAFTLFHYLLLPSLLKSVLKIQVSTPGLLIVFSGGVITCISNIDYV